MSEYQLRIEGFDSHALIESGGVFSSTKNAGCVRNLEHQAFGVARLLELEYENPTPEEFARGVHSKWVHLSDDCDTVLYMEKKA